MSISQLPQSTIKLLKCSQVITSVSSAVKELIENSLDAGASNIDVKLDNYGLDRIEVKDDGTGISPCNAAFVGLPHCTSKISTLSDIESLESYGFRGEALNSLCQVGNVTVTTGTTEDTTGTIYVLDKNGQMTSSKPTQKIKGTSIVVAYLFKNIPVRRQFFSNNKRAKEELRQVENIVKSLAVINPPVRFTLHHNKCMIWQKTAGTEFLQGIVYIVGYSPARNLHALEVETPEVKIKALVPQIGCDISILSKGNPDWSMVFINKRPVQCKSVSKIVCEYITHSFGERALQRKSPIFLVSFTLSPTRLDINLEPNKTRVLIKDEDLLLEELRSLLTQYYGNPAAKEEIANIDSPAKKRKLDPSEEQAPKPAEKLFDKRDTANGGKFEPVVEPLQPVQSVQPKLPQNDVPARRPSLHDKENVVQAGISSERVTTNILDQSMTAERWSMGHVKETDGNYIQGPGVFVTGPNIPPVKEKFQLEIASTSSKNSLTMDRERQTAPVNSFAREEKGQTVFPEDPMFPDGNISILEMQDFEKDWVLPNQGENSSTFAAAPPSAANCRADAVVNPPPANNCSEQLGPVISPPRPRNEKKNRKPLQLVPRDDEFDLSVSSQMGRREYAGFTKFARDARPQIILENPGIAFTKVAVMLSDQWKNLPPEQREKYEEKAREHAIARKQIRQPDDPSQLKLFFELKEKVSEEEKLPPKKSPQQKMVTGPSKPSKSHSLRRPQTPYRVSINIIKERTESQIKRKPVKDNYTAVGHLQPSGGWVCLKGNEISLISPYRLQEIVLTHRLLATHSLPLRQLSPPQHLEEKDLGADNWKLLLSMDRTVCNPGENSTMVVSSPIIVKNGFRIQLSETEGNTVVSLTHVAETISFYGIQDLLETLLLAATNGTGDLALCRPLRVVNHIKGEAVRICRQDPSVVERQVLEELLLYWKLYLSPTHLCLHSKPIWTPVHSIDIS